MFVVTDEKIELSSTDIVELAQFLRTDSAKRVVKALISQRPSILSKGEPHEMHFSAGKSAGYEECIAKLFEFVAPAGEIAKPAVAETYPELDDEEAWKSVAGEAKE